MALRWREWNVALHRDVGFLTAGLTLVYVASGIAVNHVHDWNPNYRIERVERAFEPIAVGDRDAMVAELVQKLSLGAMPKESFRSAPERVELFYDGWSVKADAMAGRAIIERQRERLVLRALNALHLNHLRGLWTYAADAYALSLGFLVLSGLLIPRKQRGLAGRGKYLVLAGLAVPLGFLLARK